MASPLGRCCAGQRALTFRPHLSKTGRAPILSGTGDRRASFSLTSHSSRSRVIQRTVRVPNTKRPLLRRASGAVLALVCGAVAYGVYSEAEQSGSLDTQIGVLQQQNGALEQQISERQQQVVEAQT